MPSSSIAGVRWAWLTVAVAIACVALPETGGTADTKSACRTLVVAYRGKAHHSVAMHPCDRLKVELTIHTQETPQYLWRVSRKPDARLLKLSSHGFAPAPPLSRTATQVWVYKAQVKGPTVVKFAYYTPSYPKRRPIASTKISVRVR